ANLGFAVSGTRNEVAIPRRMKIAGYAQTLGLIKRLRAPEKYNRMDNLGANSTLVPHLAICVIHGIK
ncbi:hypothetical protein ACJX0J_034808, partial [Zea mays]